MPEEPAANRMKPAALLEPDELERYRRILAYLEHQAGLVQRARLALEEAEFVSLAVESEGGSGIRYACDMRATRIGYEGVRYGRQRGANRSYESGRTMRISTSVAILSAMLVFGCGVVHRSPLRKETVMSERARMKVEDAVWEWFDQHPGEPVKLAVVVSSFVMLPVDIPESRFLPRYRELSQQLDSLSKSPIRNEIEIERLENEIGSWVYLILGNTYGTEGARRWRDALRPSRDSVISRLDEIGVKVSNRTEILGPGWVYVSATRDTIEKIAAIPRVSRIMLIPSELPRVGLNISRQVIGADRVENPQGGYPSQYPRFGSGVTVAVLDTGIGLSGTQHPFLPSSIVIPDRGPNEPSEINPNPHGFVDAVPFDSPEPTIPAEPGYDDKYRNGLDSHGTRVAGILVSQDTTYKGIAPSCTLMNVKCINMHGKPNELANVQDAVFYAFDHGAQIANASVWQHEVPATGNESLEKAFDLAQSFVTYGVTTVIVGNGSGVSVRSPGGAYNSITASAFDDNDSTDPKNHVWWSGSCVGPANGRKKPDICAPGVSIWSTEITFNDPPTQGIGPATGTSFAAPHVAGAAALVREELGGNPLGCLVKGLILHAVEQPTTRVIGGKDVVISPSTTVAALWDGQWGWGKLSAVNAVAYASGYTGAWYTNQLIHGGPAYVRTIVPPPSGVYVDITLCWDRLVTEDGSAYFARLDLEVYEQDGSKLIVRDDSTVDNVKRVRFVMNPSLPSYQVRVVPVNIPTEASPQAFAIVTSYAFQA